MRLANLRSIFPPLSACLAAMDDVEEDAALLLHLDQEASEDESYLYYLDMVDRMGPYSDCIDDNEYQPTDEELEEMRREHSEDFSE